MTEEVAYEWYVYECNKMIHRNKFKATLDIIKAFSTIEISVTIYNI